MPNLDADVTMGPGEGAGRSGDGGGGLPSLGPSSQDSGRAFKNGGYARDENTTAEVNRTLVGRVQGIRQQRITLEDAWAEMWRLWLMHHDRQAYFGRSNLYIPMARKMMEGIVAQVSGSLFPTDDVIDVTAPPGQTDLREFATLTKDRLQYDLLKIARIKQESKVFTRQLVVVGTSPVKIYWKNRQRKVKRPAHKDLVVMGKVIPMGAEYDTSVDEYVGPVWTTRDLFNWYIWPEKARSVDEAEIVFEIMEISALTLRQRGRDGVYNPEAVEDAINAAMSITPSIWEVEFAARKGFQLPPEGVAEHAPPGERGERMGPVRIVEAYHKMVLPDGPSRGYARGEPEPTVTTIAGNNIVLRCTPNPFPDKKPPYVVGRLNETTQMFYGAGVGGLISGLQHYVNDTINQTVDAASFALNPIIKRSLSGAPGPLPAARPGVIWNVLNNTGDITFERSPWELVQAGTNAAQVGIGWMADAANMPPLLQGTQPVGKGARTAQGMRILQQNSMVPLQDVVEDLEQQVFVPTLEKVALLERLYGRLTAPVEDFFYRWLASDQAMNQQVRAQQIVQLLQIAAPQIPLLQQFGKTLDPEPLLRKLYSEGFGFRDPDSFIKPVPAPMMPPGAPGTGGPGGPPRPPGGTGIPGESNNDEAHAAQEQAQAGGDGQFGMQGAPFGAMGGLPGGGP